MANLKEVANAMFYKKSDWVNITDSDKELSFFIFNRYFSKKYPEKSQLFNSKSIDKVIAMDLWYNFMLDKPYPNWFWSKSEPKEKEKISSSDIKLLKKYMKIDINDLNYLMKNNFDFIKEELKYYKQIEKGN